MNIVEGGETNMAKTESVAGEALSFLAKNERDAVVEFSEQVRQRFGADVRDIILFGSKVTGTAGSDSDIDVLIVLTRLSWDIKKAISDMAALENIKYDVLISTVRYDAATWDSPVIRASPFGHAVREQGVWL